MQKTRGDFGSWLAVGAAVWLTLVGALAVALVSWAPTSAGVAAGAVGPVAAATAAATATMAPTAPGAAPSAGGVTSAPTVAATTAPDGFALPPEYAEVRDQVIAELRQSDPGQALNLLQDIVNQRPEVAGICHPIAHDLGHAALEKYAYDFKKAISYQDGVCGNGYLHGVVEHAVLHAPDPQAALRTLCAPEQAGSCLHGIGHGAMFVADMDLPKALSFCDWFAPGVQRTSCAEGVFMQNFEVGVPGVKDSGWLKPADPFYPCATQPQRYQGSCYYYAPQYYLSLHPAGYAAGLAWCRAAPSGSDAVNSCVMGMGSRIMKYNISRVQFAEAQCLTLTDRGLRKECVLGLTSYYMVHYNDAKAGLRLCPQLTDPGDVATCKAAASAAVSSRD